MAEPTATETIQREALKNTGVDTAKKTVRHEVSAQKMRERMHTEGSRRTLEMMRGAIGITDTQKVDAAARLDPADRAASLGKLDEHNKFLRDRYDALSPAEKMASQKEISIALGHSPLMTDTLLELRKDKVAASKFYEGILQDDTFRAEVNARLKLLSEREFVPTPEDIDARKKRMDILAGAPAGTTDDAAATAELRAEFQRTLKTDIDNVMGDSVHAMIRSNIDAAEEIVITNGEELDAEVNKTWEARIMEKSEKRWSKKNPDAYKRNGTIRRDWNAFIDGGLDNMPREVLDDEQKKHLNDHPELKAKFEAQIGESLLLKRMRGGKLGKDDMTRLVDSKWLGATQGDRVDKIRDIFEAHQGFKDILAEAQANGYVSKNIWDQIKAAGPSVAAGGMLAALLMLFGFPLAAGGAIAAGTLYGANRLRQAA